MLLLRYLPVLTLVLALPYLSVCQQMDDDPVDDDRTEIPAQNEAWRTGKYKFSSKPKHMWEFGLHGGHFLIDGDIDPDRPAGYGVGFHFRRALMYAFSIRLDAFAGKTMGYDAQPTDGFVAQKDIEHYPGDRLLHRAYKAKYAYVSVQGIVNIGNILFHKPRNRWNWYLFVGVGVNTNKTMLDVYDGNGETYDYSALEGYDVDIARDRVQMIKLIKGQIHDGVYETEARLKSGKWYLNDATPLNLEFQGGVGVSRKISRRFNISIEHQVMASDHDLLDGFVYRTDVDQSNNADIAHYTDLRFSINLGNFDNKTEPLYWINPLDRTLGHILELSNQPGVGNYKDSDKDGVVDVFDKEPNTPRGAKVSPDGKMLDSDQDGYPDHIDQEPFSPPGAKVNNKGVAPAPSFGLSPEEVDEMVEKKVAKMQADWYMPMVHFDVNDYGIRTEFYPQLHQIGKLMQTDPNMRMVIRGYSDNQDDDAYNEMLSFYRAKEVVDYLHNEYGIPRENLVLQYGGEQSPIIPTETEDGDDKDFGYYLNRRVEFKVAADQDNIMGKPKGPDPFKNKKPGVKSKNSDDGGGY